MGHRSSARCRFHFQSHVPVWFCLHHWHIRSQLRSMLTWLLVTQVQHIYRKNGRMLIYTRQIRVKRPCSDRIMEELMSFATTPIWQMHANGNSKCTAVHVSDNTTILEHQMAVWIRHYFYIKSISCYQDGQINSFIL